MATLSGLRTRLRVRLEETAPAVWADAELDECLQTAFANYAARFPIERIQTLTANVGDMNVPLAPETLAVLQVQWPSGAIIPPHTTTIAPDAPALRWDVFAGTLVFTQALPAGSLLVRSIVTPTLADLPPNDEHLVLLGATVEALQARTVQDAKRGGPADHGRIDAVMARAMAAFNDAWRLRSRRLRMGTVVGA